MRRTLPRLLGLSAVLWAAAAASAATTTQLVLSPDQPTAAAIAENPALADRTTFDLMITTTADWINSSLRFVLGEGSFYNAADGGDAPTTPGQWGLPGFQHLRYDTFVAAPPDFMAWPMIIGGHMDDGGGPAIFSPGTVSVIWADTSTSYGSGTYTIARLTVSNDTVGSYYGSTFDNSLPGTPQPYNGAINKQLRWDTDPLSSGAQGGTGTWNTTESGFWNGAANVAWDNARNDVAIFGDSAGTVTVGTVAASALRFDTAGYTLAGGTITLTGSGRITANQDAAIDSTIASAVGLTKTGAGTLTISGLNTYAGVTRVEEGALRVADIAALGGTSAIQVLSSARLHVDASGSLTAGISLFGTATVDIAPGQTVHAAGLSVQGLNVLDVDGTFFCDGPLGIAAGDTLTKTGEGVATFAGSQTHGTDALLEVLGGTVNLATNAGSAAANLSIEVTSATVSFDANQYLDALIISDGGKVVLTGAQVVVLKHLVIDGMDFGGTVMTPEPATLALVALGASAVLCRRRRQGTARRALALVVASPAPSVAPQTGG